MISGTIAPSAAAATGFAGISEVNHAASVGASLATTWLAASLAPGGNGGREAAGGSHANTAAMTGIMTTAIPAGSRRNTITVRAPSRPIAATSVVDATPVTSSETTSGITVIRIALTHSVPMGTSWSASATRRASFDAATTRPRVNRDDESNQDANAVCFHDAGYIIRSPPLMSSDAPVM